VTVFDFEVSLPVIDAPPGVEVGIPLTVDRDLGALEVRSVQYSLVFSPTLVSTVEVPDIGLIAVWRPTVNRLSDRVVVAAAGAQSLGSGHTLHEVNLTIAADAPVGANVPLTLSGFLCNQGTPVAWVVNGSIHVIDGTGVPPNAALALALEPPRPNPVHDAATIAFVLPSQADASGHEDDRVRLVVYGLDGRVTRVLLDGPQTAGRHEVTWDGRDGDGHVVPAGIYFSRLAWRGRTIARRLVLVR
jgi:hypothetical protein